MMLGEGEGNDAQDVTHPHGVDRWEERYIEAVGAGHIRERAEEAGERGKDTVVVVCFDGEDDYPECHTWTILDILENERQSGLSRFA